MSGGSIAAAIAGSLSGHSMMPAPPRRSPAEQIAALSGGASAAAIGRAYHGGSVYEAPRRPLTEDGRRMFREKVRRFAVAFGARASSVMVTLEALRRHLGQDGRCDPSHATLAKETGLGQRTVRRALRLAGTAGLVSWSRRIVRTRLGARQTSNGYVLHPEAIVPDPGGQRGRVTMKKEYQELRQKEQVERTSAQAAATGWRGTIEQARAALLTRQRQIEQQLRNVMQTKSVTIRSG